MWFVWSEGVKTFKILILPDKNRGREGDLMNRDECNLSCVLCMANSEGSPQLTMKLAQTVAILTFLRVVHIWNISGDTNFFGPFCDFTQSQFTDAWIELQIRPRPLSYTYFSNIHFLLTPAFDAVFSGLLVGSFNKSQIHSKGFIRRSKIPQNRQWWNPLDKEAMQDLLKDRLEMPCCERTKKPVTSCAKNIKNGACCVIILSKFLIELS